MGLKKLFNWKNEQKRIKKKDLNYNKIQLKIDVTSTQNLPPFSQKQSSPTSFSAN